ncbi:MAG TPA: hypothetical protein VEG68_17750, partial [Terriglobales bacterium]|nr:hypothetical protein [Terriglobales bacterium]
MQHKRSSAEMWYEGSRICERGPDLKLAQVEGPSGPDARMYGDIKGWPEFEKNSVAHVTSLRDQ